MPFWEMDEELDKGFRQSDLVFIKGDAHSRRVHGDLRIPFTTPTSLIVSYFPTHLVLIRTLKSETASGLSEENLRTIREIEGSDSMRWLSCGSWGIIQYIPK